MHLSVKVGLTAVALLLSMPSFARTFDVRAWRGETVAVRVPDFAELGEAPEDVSMKVGRLAPVKYAPEPESLQIAECYDRVVWNGKGVGPRVAELTVAPEAKAGVYDIGALRLTVVDRVLPPAKDWKYQLDLWQHPWAVARVAKAKPFSRAHYAAMKPVYELLATAGQKTITVPLLDEPWDHQCRDAYHSLVDEPDFKTFDRYVSFCLECGLGPDISCYSLCPWKLKEAPGTPEFEKRWAPFLDRFVKHLKEKGWYERTVMSMDERSPEQVRAVVDFVHRHAPGMRISMAGNCKPSDFKGIDIDAYAQLLDHVTPDFLAEVPARREKGFVTTFYVCCSPYSPNTFLPSGQHEPFWIGAFPAFAGLDGFLRWAWCSWPEDPVADASYGWWKAGDTFLCYPGGEPSIRFLMLRNGIVAAGKIRILREAGALDETAFAKLAKCFVVKEAIAGTSNFRWLCDQTNELVNGR